MAIARIQPLSAAAHHLNPSLKNSTDSDEKQVFTVWMKSLVFNGRGCTIYGQDGRVAYRVDNYACRRSREVYLMDSAGNTLVKLLKKNFGVFKTWQGYSYCNGSTARSEEGTCEPWFRVQKEYKILKKKVQYSVRATVEIAPSGEVYKIEGMSHKSGYKIIGADGEVVAEIKRKQTDTGLALGKDVLSLTVGPTVDRVLVVGLVVVCGLLNRRI